MLWGREATRDLPCPGVAGASFQRLVGRRNRSLSCACPRRKSDPGLPGAQANWPAIKQAPQRRFGHKEFADNVHDRLAAQPRSGRPVPVCWPGPPHF